MTSLNCGDGAPDDFWHNPAYQRRFVVFFDILGWSEKIRQAGDQPGVIGNLRRIMLTHTRMGKLPWKTDVKATTFSDNVVISQSLDGPIDTLIYHIGLLQLASTSNGFLLRGGATIGNIIHDSEVVFGPALNRAYYLERDAARYPRIVLDKFVMDELRLPLLPNFFVADGDFVYLDPFTVGFMKFAQTLHNREVVKRDFEEVGMPFGEGVRTLDRDYALRRAAAVLKYQLLQPIADKDYEKLTWLYDRIASRLGVPPASSYPRVRPGDVVE